MILPLVCGELFGQQNVKSALAIIFVYQGLSIVVATFTAGKPAFLNSKTLITIFLQINLCFMHNQFYQ